MSAQTVYDENLHLSAANLKLYEEIWRLQEAKRAALKVADERSKENCALKQLLRDARDHVPWDVLKRIDEALGASRAEQTSRSEEK